MAKPPAKDPKVNLLKTIELLQRYVTEALCRSVFNKVRDRERQRKWTLYALISFWTEVIIRAPKALSHALAACAEGVAGWSQVRASPEAFFQKNTNMRPAFFREIFQRFLPLILPEAELAFCTERQRLYQHFKEVWVIDGSRLAAVWHRLKMLWNVPHVVLPGALLAVYDLRRGILRVLHYDPDAARAEISRAIESLQCLPGGTLLVADRLYAVAKFFASVIERHGWVVARRNKTVKFRTSKKIRRSSYKGGQLTESLVEVGGTGKTPAQSWRHITWSKANARLELVTNVLDSGMLPAAEAIQLYRDRWTVERMFFDLKEVLNLNRLYCCSPNAVGQQVYAAALVYTALRVAQGQVAWALKVRAEQISVPKFFPRISAAASQYPAVLLTLATVEEMNPNVVLVLPDISKMKFASVRLSQICVEKRKGTRRKKRYCKERRQWKSFAHIEKMSQN